MEDRDDNDGEQQAGCDALERLADPADGLHPELIGKESRMAA
ncbi:MAG: hypothetical protein ACI9UA_006228, partial [Pseudoalteromonas tetraodonis]